MSDMKNASAEFGALLDAHTVPARRQAGAVNLGIVTHYDTRSHNGRANMLI